MSELSNVNLPSVFDGFGGGSDGGFGHVASAAGGSPRALYLSFNGKVGGYAFNGESIPPGKRGIVGKATAAWVRLSQGEPPYRVFQQPNKPLIRREDLPDKDEKLWPTVFGQAADPWKEEMSLYMADPETGDLVVFSTMSVTGRNAVIDFCRKADFQQRSRGAPDLPIVEFGIGSFEGAYGTTPIPKLTIVGWVKAASELPPPKASNPAPAATSTKKKSASPSSLKDDDLDDDLPF
jgi:hypothetical protein